MANINDFGNFTPFKTDLNRLVFVKSRASHKCYICNETIPSRSFCLGKSGGWWWSRICLNCAYDFLNNFIKSVEDFKQIGLNVLKDINENKDKYMEINTVAKI